jgi:hypothetical protein
MSDKNSKEFSSVLDSDGNVVADPFRNNNEISEGPGSDFAFIGMPIDDDETEWYNKKNATVDIVFCLPYLLNW